MSKDFWEAITFCVVLIGLIVLMFWSVEWGKDGAQEPSNDEYECFGDDE